MTTGEFCSKRFSDSSTLLVHKRLHTNENPYICHLCGRRTKQASNLRSHYKHFHKNNDISGRQIRLNSRIFNRFSQTEINEQLEQTGDLMSLLERGMLEFDREEKEKNCQIEKALQVISVSNSSQNITLLPNGKIILCTPNENNSFQFTLFSFLVVNNPIEDEINLTDHVEVKVTKEKKEATPAIVKQHPKAGSQVNRRSTRRMINSNVDCSEDVKDIQLVERDNLDNERLLYDSIAISLNKDVLKIESVFIEDSECSQPLTEHFSIDDIKKETNSYDEDSNDVWSPAPFEIIKYESLATDEPTKVLDQTLSNAVSSKTDSIKSKQSSTKLKAGNRAQHKLDNKVEKLHQKEQSKVISPKTVMEKCIPCNRKFHDMSKHWVQFHSGTQRRDEIL